MRIWNSKCAWDIIWLQEATGCQDIYTKRDGKWLVDSMGIWNIKLF